MSEYEQHRNEEEACANTEIIHLAEEFQLFKPQRTEKYYFRGDVVHLFSDVCLDTGFIDAFIVTIFAEFDNTFARIEVVTPFDPQQGYPLDEDDFSSDSRKLKIERLKDELLETVEGFTLLLGYADDSSENMFGGEMPAHLYRFLDSVYLVLLFPSGSSFVSRAYYDSQSLSLTFDKFFPSDTGPLPVLEPIKTEKRLFRIDEGLRILLPHDLEKLERIKGKFLYIPE